MKKKLVSILLGVATLLFGCAFVGCESADETSSECKHEHVSVIEMEAKCLTDGQRITTCADCGSVETIVLPKLGHALGEATVTEATCTAPITYIAQCTRPGCGGFEETTEGESLGHNYQVASTIPANCMDDEQEVLQCSRCDLCNTVVKENGAKATGHKHVVVENGTKQATCTEAGGALYRCLNTAGGVVCGDEYTEVVPATGHTSDNVKAEVTEPSCTEKGYTTYHCATCKTDYKYDYTQPIGHSIIAGATAQASCSTMGYKARVCNNTCNNVACKYIERYDVTANLAHNFGADGKCTSCNKTAKEAFILECGETNKFLIEETATNTYKVYSKAYSEQKIVIPYAMVERLVAADVNMIVVHVGSLELGGEARSLSVRVNGGEAKMINTSGNELKQLLTIDIADENGKILANIPQSGITLAVYYRALNYIDSVVGSDKVDSYAIKLQYKSPLRPADYLYAKSNTDSTVTYDETTGRYTATTTGDGSFYTCVESKWMATEFKEGRTVMTLELYSANIAWIQVMAPFANGNYNACIASHTTSANFNHTGITFATTTEGNLTKWSVTIDLANVAFNSAPDRAQYYSTKYFESFPMDIITNCTTVDIAISFSAPVANA